MRHDRKAAGAIVLTLVAGACAANTTPTAAPVVSPSASVSATTSSPEPSDTPSSRSPSVEPSVSPTSVPSPAADLPEGLPTSYDQDVAAGRVPPDELVPPHAQVTDAVVMSTASGEAIVVMWAVPSDDPFRTPAGWAAWRRFRDAPAWRPVLGRGHPAEDGVLGIAALAADVTGDGSEDAVLFEASGGSGGCGTYLVADLAADQVVFSRSLCDGRIDPSAHPVGLTVTTSVFLDGDPHCCPSRTKTSVLTYAGDGAWQVASSEVVDNAA